MPAKPEKAPPTRTYPLGPDGQRTLELRWLDTGIHASVDGKPVHTFADEDALAAGKALNIPNSPPIDIKLLRGWMQRELIVLQGGFPLPGSASHPAVRIASVANAIGFWAIVNLLFGIATSIWAAPFQVGSVNGLAAVAVGAFLGALSYSVRRHYSQIALLLATTLIAFEFAGPLFLRSQIATPPSGNMTLAILFVLIWMWGITRQGMEAIRLRQRMPGNLIE